MPLSKRQIFVIFLLCCLIAKVEAKPLHLVTEAWVPYVYEKNGKPAGLDYEITREVLHRLNVELELQFMPWKRCLLAMEQGSADGILDIFHLPEREAHMQFIDEPLSDIEFVLFFARNRPYPFKHLDDLRGLVVGVSPGYWYTDEAFRNSKLFRREEAPTHEANLGKLVRNRVDLVVNDRRAGLYLAGQLGLERQLGYNPTPVSRGRLYLALRRDPALRPLAEAFSRELRRFKREPAYAQLLGRYATPVGAVADHTP